MHSPHPNLSLFEQLVPTQAAPLEQLHWPLAGQCGVKIWLKRDDLISQDCSGNKWYKLAYNIQDYFEQGYSSVLSFGGGYSNHLHALAKMGARLGIRTIGVVRGHYSELTATLRDCRDSGMKLVFVSKREWSQLDPDALRQAYGNPLIIPEGGNNRAGFLGCVAMGQHLLNTASSVGLTEDASVKVALACGTGTTMAGVVAGVPRSWGVDGISVLKGEDTLSGAISARLRTENCGAIASWRLHTDFHCGGYAKAPRALIQAILDFEQQHQVLLDPVYTSKVVFAVQKLLSQGYYQRGDNIIIIHTGGIQGRRGFRDLSEEP